MHKVDSFGATPANEFQNPSPGVSGTYLEAKFMNTLQRELTALVTRCGVSLTDTDDEQLSERLVLTVANLAALRACPVAGVNRFIVMLVRGSATQGDGGGAAYYWSNSATGADDGLDTIVPATAPATGRWKRSALLGTGTTATFAANQALGTNNTLIANTAFVQAAIAALVASSPAALDTLNELAAALGNDANFATTITNLLALKAPLASPSLTGNPLAPTQAPGTNNTSISNTAFVQAAIAAAIAALLVSPAFSGTPTGPTAAAGTNTTQLANTAFVQAALNARSSVACGVNAAGVSYAAFATSAPIPFDSIDHVGIGGVFVTSSTQITIPAGVSKVRISAGTKLTSLTGATGDNTPSWSTLALHKNGSSPSTPWDFDRREHRAQFSFGVILSFQTPTMAVVPGDYFELRVGNNHPYAGGVQAGATWAVLEVIG